jgi:hypothetical protein
VTPDISRVKVPEMAAIVPRDIPSSNSSTVAPDSTVPLIVNEVPTEAPLAGETKTGASGGVASSITTTMPDGPDVPAMLVALAVSR